MRIKRDKTSDNASSILTRDNRHDKSFDGASSPARKKKKNKKKWCKGIEGRQHKLVHRKWHNSLSHWREDMTEIACEVCGKQFEAIWETIGKKRAAEMVREIEEKLGYETLREEQED